MGARTAMLLETPIPVETAAPEYNITERLDAAFELGMKDIFTSRQYQEDHLEELASNDPHGLSSPEELNELFTDVEKPFTKPTSYLFANELNEEAKEKKRLMGIISNHGKSDAFGISLLGGLAAHATDPIEAGADVLLGLATGGLGTAAKWGAKSGKLGYRATKIAKRTSDLLESRNLTRSVVEGVAANAALEPYFMSSSERMQEDYTINDALISVVGGGVVFPGAAFGLKKGGKYVADNAPWMGQAIKSVIGQVASGKKPDLSAIIELRKNHLYGVSNVPHGSIRAGYKYTKLEDVDLPNQKFYVSTVQKKGTVEYGDHHVVGDFMGNEGTHITDNPNLANQLANDTLQDTVGGIHEINLHEANLLNIDTGFDSPVIPKIKDTINKFNPEYTEAFLDAKTLREGIENVKTVAELNGDDVNAILKNIHDDINTQGYNGVIYSEDGAANHAYIYNEGNLKHSDSFKADSKAQPKPDQEMIRGSADDMVNKKENDIMFNEHSQKDIDETPDLKAEDFDRAVIEQVKNEEANLRELVETGMADEADELALREIEIEEEMMKGKNTIFQTLKNCFLKGK